MPNRTPRIAITLPPDLHATIATIARCSKTPASRVCAEILTEAAPALARIADTLQQVQQANAARRAEILARLEPLAAEADAAALAALSMLDRLAAATEAPEPRTAPGDARSARPGEGGPTAGRRRPASPAC